MVEFIVMTGAWPNTYKCFAERVPVEGEIFEIEGSDWTVGVVSWRLEVKNSSGFVMQANVSLYKKPAVRLTPYEKNPNPPVVGYGGYA